MSRVGKKPILIPKNVKVSVTGNTVLVEGPKGKLTLDAHPNMTVEAKEEQVIVSRRSDEKSDKALHGLTRTLINNMVVGTTVGYQKELEIQGVGFRAQVSGKKIDIPSYQVKVGDQIILKDKYHEKVKKSREGMPEKVVPAWLVMDEAKLEGKVVALPSRDDIEGGIQENYIVEFYSR